MIRANVKKELMGGKVSILVLFTIVHEVEVHKFKFFR